MVRQDNALSATSDVSLADGNVTIKAHPGITALGKHWPGCIQFTRCGTSAGFARLQQGERVQMMDFSPSRSLQTQNVIEINDIRLESENALEKQPLEITLRQPGVANELILPVAFDGHHFRVIGDAVADEQGTHIKVREIPDSSNTSADGAGERGIFKSLKMTLCKVALEQQDVNQLRYVQKMEDGSITLQRESIGIKIGKAKKVLLVLHGMAGDGLDMYKAIHENLPEASLQGYDLVLIYDYESLNTPLDETARMLGATLSDYGFGNMRSASQSSVIHWVG